MGRMMAKVIADLSNSHNYRAQSYTLEPSPESPLPNSDARRSRIRFASHMHASALTTSHFVYDFLGMARAHCRIPFFSKPFLTYMHGIEVWENAPRRHTLLAHRASMLLSNSAYTRDRAFRTLGHLKTVRVCWLGTEDDNPPAYSRRIERPRVLVVGRMVEGYKGHDELIRCWPKVVSKIKDAQLVIAGTGPLLAHYMKMAENTVSDPDRIVFRGFVSDDRLSEEFSQATIFALPSRGEGFGLVYIEAMRHNVPVLGSIHDAAAEINVDGQTGYNVDLDKPDDLADRIIYLLTNSSAAATLGANAFHRWQQHFRFSAFSQRFTPLLDEFLGV